MQEWSAKSILTTVFRHSFKALRQKLSSTNADTNKHQVQGKSRRLKSIDKVILPWHMSHRHNLAANHFDTISLLLPFL